MGPWQLTDSFRTKLVDEGLRPGSATWKLALFQSTSNLSTASTTYAGVTNQVANANGYVTGGISVTLTRAGTTTVTVSFTTVPQFSASGGSIVARWVALYEASDDVAAFALLNDTPADVTIVPGSPFGITNTDVLVLA